MTKKILIDATHEEETRVAIVDGHRLEEFDFVSSTKEQLKSNIYLAKVTRVEPSLQAAFVDYGGNRHGFLAFNEIHPDYYQIPVSDREELVEEEAASAEESDENGVAETVEEVGGDELEEEQVRRRSQSYRRYKIQEVIKRRQIMLVQVVKEERGNKGAALTTYLSLAGRYCVLMPNTARGGGISRKIANAGDRKRLKKIVDDLNIVDGMAVIVRTAGAERTKADIRRDYEYLLKQWDKIRSLTLESTAPCLINEEANLITRTIRDLYSKDIEEILVEGDDGYKLAKEFMKALLPSHARHVKQYKDESVPILHRYNVESQIDAVHNPIVQLKSGGYLVINPTEALVAIDVNSGRATRERNIEETAYRTNMETAAEVARQLRLRDLAGLIVIDFIDMEVSRNIHAVERKLKDSLKSDRARIQVGRISPFGLMEMSRQRLRPSVTETSSEVCPVCGGLGHVRSTESAALHVLRAIEEEGIRQKGAEIVIRVSSKVALYILNQKRAALMEIEARYNFHVAVEADDTLIPPEYKLERSRSIEGASVPAPAEVAEEEKPAENERRRRRSRRRRGRQSDEMDTQEAANASEEETAVTQADEDGETAEEQPKKRSRRGRRGGRRRGRRPQEGAPEGSQEETAAETETPESGMDDQSEQAEPAMAGGEAAVAGDAAAEDATPEEEGQSQPSEDNAAEAAEESKPRRRPRRRRRSADRDKKPDSAEAADQPSDAAAEDESAEPADVKAEDDDGEKPKRRRRSPARAKESQDDTGPAADVQADVPAVAEAAGSSETTAEETPPSGGNGADTGGNGADTESHPDAVPAAAVQPEAASESPPDEPVADEPVADESTPSEPPKPRRGGWWQRVLG